MREEELKESIKSVLLVEAEHLTVGIIHQGIQRTVKQITTSSLTPPIGYYFISIQVPTVKEGAVIARTNTRRPPMKAVYTVRLEVTDVASLELSTEDQPYETATKDFHLFTNRIVQVLRDYYTTGRDYFSLRKVNGGASEISKTNASASWEDASDTYSLLYTEIEFQMECSNESTN